MSLRLADAGGSAGVLPWHHVVVSGSRKELTSSRQLPNWTPSDTVQTTIPRVATGWGGLSSTQPADLQNMASSRRMLSACFITAFAAIRRLRWSNIDMETKAIRWRAENEKTGYEHRTPVTAEVLAVLEEARMRNPRGGDSPVLPARKDPSRCLDRSRLRVWWDKAQRLAGLEPKRGRAWHSLRRKFASDLMDQPLKVVCQVGSWKTAQTVLQCYQRADENQLRTALGHRRRIRS